MCTVRTGNGARSAPRPPARLWNSTRAGSNSKGSVSRSGTQGCLRQRSTYVIRMCELERGIGARHRRRPDAAPRLEADAHPDAARIDMAQVDREVDLRAHGVAEDDDPVGERRPRPEGPDRRLVGAGVAKKKEGDARSGERDEDERGDGRPPPAAHATPPLRAARGGTRSSRGRRRARRRARSTRAAPDRGRAASARRAAPAAAPRSRAAARPPPSSSGGRA